MICAKHGENPESELGDMQPCIQNGETFADRLNALLTLSAKKLCNVNGVSET